MADKKIAVFGIYATRDECEQAADELINFGFSPADLSVLLPENLANATNVAVEKSTKAPEAASAGAASGATIGGALGLLAGLGALAVPGVGPFLASGPLIGALAGIGVGGAVGGFTGALIGLGIPEYEAKLYEGRLQKGGILFSVYCDSIAQVKTAKEILARTGARDVAAASESSHAKKDREIGRRAAGSK
ncbi:MAG TPA: hypothetical protein VKB26_02505 [Candidatus Acidoferrales bacterium]|nr:hypothetical protein [Candidatus Acidoferrales bacterium]